MSERFLYSCPVGGHLQSGQEDPAQDSSEEIGKTNTRRETHTHW